MKVELLNKEEITNLYSHWGNFAKVCYDTKTKYPEKIGKHCKNSGHYSGSRTQYFEFLITDVPRFLIDQAVRSEAGVVKNVQSFRYVDKSSFCYEVPVEILDNKELLDKYNKHMKNTIELYEEIQTYVHSKTESKERANEQARYVLPMATHSAFVIGFTLEALIHYCNARLCTRTEDIHRQLAKQIKAAALEVFPELKGDLVPKCQRYLYCEESHTCGAYPKKEELVEILKKKGQE